MPVTDLVTIGPGVGLRTGGAKNHCPFNVFLALPDSNPVPRILNVLNQRLNWIWLSEYKLSTIRYSASEKPFLSAFFRVSYPPHTREVMGSSPIGSIAAERSVFFVKSGFPPFLYSRVIGVGRRFYLPADGR